MGILYKTICVPIKCSNQDYEYLSSLNRISAEVWNKIIEIEKSYRETNDGKWINRSELQKSTKGIAGLHAKGIQHIVNKYLYARESAMKIKGKGEKCNYPHRKKKFLPTGWTYQCIKIDTERSVVFLSKPYKFINGKKIKQKPVKCKMKNIPQYITQIELIHNGVELQLSIKYKEDAQYLQVKSNNHASIDLGEIHAIASIDSSGNAIIITGRKMRSIKQLRNKHQAKIYSRMSKCKYGSKQYWKYRNTMKKLSLKIENKINDSVHKISKLYLDFCIMNNISTVYYGDLDGVSRDSKNKNKGNNVTRQKLSQWNRGELIKQLEVKISRYGIKMIKVKEYYTSQKCPCCENLNKVKNREYKCNCGYKQHRDIVGAINILNDNSGIKLVKYKTKKYLQIA